MKIGELAKATATNIETIRYYERIGLLAKTPRTSANYRVYGSDHLARLSFIRRARDLGFPLAAISQLLALSDDRDQPCEAVDQIAQTQLTAVVQKIEDLAALRSELERMIHYCSRGKVADCNILEALAPRSS